MTGTARIPRTEVTGIVGAMARRYSAKKLGQVPEPLGVMWHNRPVLKAFFGLSAKADRWDACDPQLKAFGHMAAVSLVGCGFCADFGYVQAHNERLDVDKAREVPRWRESTVFSPLEREVMEYAEAMTRTPPTVTDDMSERLLRELGASALVELTAFVALANMASRTNVALGIESQDFSGACGLRPLATATAGVASAA